MSQNAADVAVMSPIGVSALPVRSCDEFFGWHPEGDGDGIKVVEVEPRLPSELGSSSRHLEVRAPSQFSPGPPVVTAQSSNHSSDGGGQLFGHTGSVEQWRPVAGWEGLYEVSDQGRICSIPRKGVRGGVLWASVKTRGYRGVTLCRGGERRYAWVHQLVIEAFDGPRPPGHQIRHLDGDRLNNRRENLSYGSASENMLDSVRHGTHAAARKTHCKQGHKFTRENTLRQSNGCRRCRECDVIRKRRGRGASTP